MIRHALPALLIGTLIRGASADTPATDAPATDTPPADSPATDTPSADSRATDAPATEPTGRETRATDEEEGEPKLSLPTEADRIAWRRSGFRLSLGGGYGHFAGIGGAPSGRLLGATLRVGLRLDATWSLLASFQYARASQAGGLAGLRFSGTLDPTWHVTPWFALSLGIGVGGIVEGNNTGRMDASPLAAELETSYTFPDASTPIARCGGLGIAGLVRAEYAIVLGPRSQFHVSAEGIGQWTGCLHDTNRFEPDTGNAIVRRQYWPHAGVFVGAGFTWR